MKTVKMKQDSPPSILAEQVNQKEPSEVSSIPQDAAQKSSAQKGGTKIAVAKEASRKETSTQESSIEEGAGKSHIVDCDAEE